MKILLRLQILLPLMLWTVPVWANIDFLGDPNCPDAGTNNVDRCLNGCGGVGIPQAQTDACVAQCCSPPPQLPPPGQPTGVPTPRPTPGPTLGGWNPPGFDPISNNNTQQTAENLMNPRPCVDQDTDISDWGACNGEFGSWNTTTNARRYEGTECRTITTTDSCGGQEVEEDCRPCGYEQVDDIDPVCESVVDWEMRPLESVVLSCEDDLSGCDESSYENGERNVARTEVLPARACDEAGNCVDCPITNPDTVAPTCVATFRFPGRWHRADEFEANGGDLTCWLENCEDEGVSGCLPLGTLENTEKIFNDPGGMREEVAVEQDPIEPIHRDTCQILACDNAGNCSTCESPEIAYDGTNVCRATDQNCDSCAEDDIDCRCISGERDQCTDSGPVNCYTDPFNLRCPGFENEACLSNNFIPGCPVFNPCYPETNRDHPRIEASNCPADAIRFCSRNPYHYGCNEACKYGLIECDPDVPEGNLNYERWGIELGTSSAETESTCPELGDCPSDWEWVRDGVDADGCVIAYCEEPVEQIEDVNNEGENADDQTDENQNNNNNVDIEDPYNLYGCPPCLPAWPEDFPDCARVVGSGPCGCGPYYCADEE